MWSPHARLDSQDHVINLSDLIRRTEVDALLAAASQARTKLGWQATIILAVMIAEMAEAALVARRRCRVGIQRSRAVEELPRRPVMYLAWGLSIGYGKPDLFVNYR